MIPATAEWPRHAAARIWALPVAERAAAVDALPDNTREPVRYYLDCYIPDLSVRRRVARAARAVVDARKAPRGRAVGA